MQNSLRFRLIIILIILASGPLLLAGVIIAQRGFSFERNQAYDLQRQVAQNVSTEAETFFLGINNDLATLGNEIRNLENPDQAQQLGLMLSLLNSGAYRDAYDELTLLDPNGREIVRLSPEEIIPNIMLKDRSEQEEFKQPVSSRTAYYSPVAIDQNTGKAQVTIALPLYEPRSTNLRGVLIANIRLASISNIMGQVQVGQNQTIYLTDANGDLLAHQDRTKDLKGKRIELPKAPSTQRGLEGDSVILAADRIELGDQLLYIVAEKPVSIALALAFTTVYTLVGVIILALVVASILGLFAIRQIVTPIEGLASAAQRVAKGDLSQKAVFNRRDEIGVLSTAFNSMTSQLLDLIGSLEQRVKDRTTELTKSNTELEAANKRIEHRAAQFEALAAVTQAITSIRDLQQLLPIITKVISEKFGFYHVGIFLLDDLGEYAVLSAANSAGGKRMLERKHHLRVGEQGIVGNVTSTGMPRIAMDVGQDAVFFNNPDLPNTHSEMALPLQSENLITGALDVQSTETAAFSEEDIQMLGLLARQVSLAIENARLFDETRRALAESEAISRQSTREAWKHLPDEQNFLGYRFNIVGASPLNEPIKLSESAKDKGKGRQKEAGQVVFPIELRGETIGTLVVQSPSADTLNQDQLDLIKAVAERVALSAENARLFEETTRRAARERLVSDITSKIRSVNDPQSMIQTAMEELRKALGASRVEVIPQAVKGAE